MSMLSLQIDQIRELLASGASDRELAIALRDAAETIESLMLKREAADKVIGRYPDGTLVVRVEELERVRRVMVETGHFCKMFYEDRLVQVSDGTEEDAVK